MWTRLLHPASDQDGVSDSVLTLTAIILLLRPLDVWWVAPFVLALACLTLVLRQVRRAPITWLLVALLVAVRIAVVWPLSDNHIYLLAYWCLAIGLSLSGPAPAATLSTNSRWLLTAAFALAVPAREVSSPHGPLLLATGAAVRPIDGAADGFAALYTHHGRLVGATYVAEHAGESVPLLTLAVAQQMTPAELAAVIHCYPTQVEAIQRAAAQPAA